MRVGRVLHHPEKVWDPREHSLYWYTEEGPPRPQQEGDCLQARESLHQKWNFWHFDLELTAPEV